MKEYDEIPPIDNLKLIRGPFKGDVVVPSDAANNPKNTVSITNNPILDNPGNEDIRTSVVNDIFDQIKNFSFGPIRMVIPGIPNVSIGDKFKYLNQTEAEKICFITHHNLKYNGGLESTIEASMEINGEENSGFIGNFDRAELNTEILVDKQRGIIESLVQKITSQGEEISRIKARNKFHHNVSDSSRI